MTPHEELIEFATYKRNTGHNKAEWDKIISRINSDAIEGAIDHLGQAHILLAKSSLQKDEYNPISRLLALAKVELFNYYYDYKHSI